MSEVLVIGGGVAGVSAALAAKEAGARVTLVQKAPGMTALCPGAWDIAPDPAQGPGRPLGRGRTIAEAVEDLARARPRHPYAVIGSTGREKLEPAVAGLVKRLGSAGLKLTPFDPRKTNRYVMDPTGVVRSAGVVEASMGGLDLSAATGKKVGVLLAGWHPSLDLELVYRTLRSLSPGPAEVHPIRTDAWPEGPDAPFLLPVELARTLENAEGRGTFVKAISKACRAAGLDHLLVPAIAGRSGAGEICQVLSRELDLTVTELPGGEASLPGIRLMGALDRVLKNAEIQKVVGEVAVRGDTFAAGESAWTAPRVVLATGRFLGGGIARDGRWRETVFDLPVRLGDRVLDEASSEHLTHADPAGHQPIFQAGIRVDGALRPLGLDDRPVRPGLYAAGDVLGGFDPTGDRCGFGVAALSGYLAGTAAAADAGASR